MRPCHLHQSVKTGKTRHSHGSSPAPKTNNKLSLDTSTNIKKWGEREVKYGRIAKLSSKRRFIKQDFQIFTFAPMLWCKNDDLTRPTRCNHRWHKDWWLVNAKAKTRVLPEFDFPALWHRLPWQDCYCCMTVSYWWKLCIALAFLLWVSLLRFDQVRLSKAEVWSF